MAAIIKAVAILPSVRQLPSAAHGNVTARNAMPSDVRRSRGPNKRVLKKLNAKSRNQRKLIPMQKPVAKRAAVAAETVAASVVHATRMSSVIRPLRLLLRPRTLSSL